MKKIILIVACVAGIITLIFFTNLQKSLTDLFQLKARKQAMDCRTFIGPGVYEVRRCDQIKQTADSKVAAYIDDVSDGNISINYIISTDRGKFITPLPHLTLSSQSDLLEHSGAGFFGIQLIFNKGKIEVTKNCKPIHKRCMKDFNNRAACATLCPYEATDGYAFFNVDDRFFAKAPTGHEEYARCEITRLQNGMPRTEAYVGFDFPFPQTAILSIEENPFTYTGGHARGDAAIWPFLDTTSTSPFYRRCLEDYENFTQNVMTGHETNHNMFMGSALHETYGDHAEFEEGLVNYISFFNGVNQEGEPPLICLNNGYRLSNSDEIRTYRSNDTFSGQCFWQRIEKDYGHDIFVQIMQKLDESRFIDPQTGHKPQTLLFRDIINPIIGFDRMEQRAYQWYKYIESDF